MLSKAEREDNVPVFDGKAWEFRKEDIKKRIYANAKATKSY